MMVSLMMTPHFNTPAIFVYLIKYFMETATVKEEIHQMINNIEDLEFLKAVQTIITAKVQDTSEGYELTEEEIKMLNEREENYLSGKSKTYTWEEVKSHLKPKPNV